MKITSITKSQAYGINVYNLRVEECPEYFANGILVHNCPSCPNYEQRTPVPIDQIVPIGADCECGGRCRCQVAYVRIPNLSTGVDLVSAVQGARRDRASSAPLEAI